MTAGGGLLPSLPFPKKNFLRIYSEMHLHLPMHHMGPLTPSFITFEKYVCVLSTCQAPDKVLEA